LKLPFALAVDEERRGEDVFLVEHGLVVDQDRHAIAEHLDAAELAHRKVLQGLETHPRPLGAQEILDLIG
jgi:hypothetical protein